MPRLPPRTAHGQGKQHGYTYWRQGSDTLRSGRGVYASAHWNGACKWSASRDPVGVRLFGNTAMAGDKLARSRQLVKIAWTYGNADLADVQGGTDKVAPDLLQFMASHPTARLEANHFTQYWWNCIGGDLEIVKIVRGANGQLTRPQTALSACIRSEGIHSQVRFEPVACSTLPAPCLRCGVKMLHAPSVSCCSRRSHPRR